MAVVVPPQKYTEKHTRPMSETISSEIAKISDLIGLDVVYNYALFRLNSEFPDVLNAIKSRQDFKSQVADLLSNNLQADIVAASTILSQKVSPNQLKQAGLYANQAYEKVEKIIQIAEEVEHQSKKQQILFDCGFVRYPEKGTVSFIVPEGSRLLSIIGRIQEVWTKERDLYPDQQELIFPAKLKQWEQNPDFSELFTKSVIVEIKPRCTETESKSIADQEKFLAEQGLQKPKESYLALAFLLNFLATGKDLFEGSEVRAENVTLKFSKNTGLANSFYVGQPHNGTMVAAILIKESALSPEM